MGKNLILLGVFFNLLACSSNSVRIETKPAAAQVFLAGKLVGNTPIELKPEMDQESFKKQLLDIKIVKEKFEVVNVLVPASGEQNLTLNLKPYDAGYFAERVLHDFSGDVNLMVRELLEIQGLLVAKKSQLAQDRLNSFLRKYPNVAPAYVLQSSLDIEKKDQSSALRNLQRALSIDPTDATVVRLVEKLKRERSAYE